MDVPLIEQPCPCGNRDGCKYHCYRGDEGDLFGILCGSCGKEWLQERFLENNTGVSILYEKERLFFRGKDRSTMSELGIDGLLPGSHIRWSEVVGSETIPADAIVESFEGNLLMSVISLQKLRFCEVTVGRMLVDLTKVSDLRLVEYCPKSDPTDLVRARALTWCSGTEEYNLFTSKGKAFAEYCKCGPGHSWRTFWLAGSLVTTLLKTLLGPSWITGEEEDCATVVEQRHTKRKIRAGILFVMNGSAIAFDMQDMICEKRVTTKPEDFLDSFIMRFISVLRDSGMKVSGAVASRVSGGGIGSLEIPAISVSVSFFIGSVIRGSVLRAPQKLVGSVLGRAFGQAIHRSVKRGDEEVPIEDLHPGDQVVLPGHLSHPRCHAILVSVNVKTRKIRLIRNTYERGVVEEWVEVAPTVLRVNYGEDTPSKSGIVPGGEAVPEVGQEVIARARSRLGEKRYSLIMYNCKHFAAWCKKVN